MPPVSCSNARSSSARSPQISPAWSHPATLRAYTGASFKAQSIIFTGTSTTRAGRPPAGASTGSYSMPRSTSPHFTSDSGTSPRRSKRCTRRCASRSRCTSAALRCDQADQARPGHGCVAVVLLLALPNARRCACFSVCVSDARRGALRPCRRSMPLAPCSTRPGKVGRAAGFCRFVVCRAATTCALRMRSRGCTTSRR